MSNSLKIILNYSINMKMYIANPALIIVKFGLNIIPGKNIKIAYK
jgi:hypothetical protein